jgi:uncharacterized membrane protein YqgA involved in biofilm formation
VFPGFGTLVNAAAVIIGSALGLLLGHRLPIRTRETVTDALGLVTLLIAALSATKVTSATFEATVGGSAPVLIVLGALLLGGIAGSLIDIERRLEEFGDWLRNRLTRGARGVSSRERTESRVGSGDADRIRFIDGFVTAMLVFCVGPLTILGSLSDGLGLGPDQLLLKAALDGFASIAFAAAFGVGVMFSVVGLVLVQGTLTLVGFVIGDVLPAAHLAAITACGGLVLLGLGLRLLGLKRIPVANLLPALVVAPLLVQVVALLR